MAGQLRAVLDRHQGNGELSELLDAPALEVAQALLDLSELGEAEVRAIAVLGEFHWQRFKVLGFEHGEPDFHRAQFSLQLVLQQDRDCLPEELRTEVIPGLVDGWQHLAERTPGEAPNRGEVLLGLASALRTRYMATFRREHLDEALGMTRAGLTVLPPGSEYRVPGLMQLENLLAHRFELAHELADLEQAIEACEEAVPLTRQVDAQRAALLSDLGMHERARFKLTGVPADLMRALDHGRGALEAVPPQSVQWQEAARELFASAELWASRIDDLPVAEGGDRATLSAFLEDLRERHGALFIIRNAVDLAESAAHASQAADASPTHDADAGLRHWAAGLGMVQRFTRNGACDRLDIEAAVRHFRAALASLPQEDLTAVRAQLGGALLQRNRPEDLDEAIDLLRVVVASDPDSGSREGSLDLAAAWSNLGIALWTRCRRRRSMDLDGAIEALSTAAELLPEQERDSRLQVLGLLASLLAVAAQLHDDEERFQAALAIIRREPGAAENLDGQVRRQLTEELVRLAFRQAEGNHLDAAIADMDVAAQIVGGSMEPAGFHDVLGQWLGERYRRTGDVADLDRSEDSFRRAIERAPAKDLFQVSCHANLAVTLKMRYEAQGASEDLESAIRANDVAVRLARPDHPERGALLSNRGIFRMERFSLSNDPEDLDIAVGALTEAVAGADPTSPAHGHFSNGLGNALRSRFELTAVPADIDRAINVLRSASETPEASDEDRATYLNNLGIALRRRFRRLGDQGDLDASIEAHRHAIGLSDPSVPGWAKDQSSYATALLVRFKTTGEPAHREAAVAEFAKVVERADAIAVVRIRAAQAAAELTAVHDPGRAADFLQAVVPLLETVALRRLDLKDRQRMLSDYSSLAADAAALALRDPRVSPEERAARALVLLETGRGVLLGQGLELRRDLARLRDADPHLAGRLEELRAELGRVYGSATDRRRLDERLRETLLEIRAVDGFSEFGRRPSLAELKRQASDGPVVVFNISSYGSDAILVTGHGIRSLELPRLTKKATAEKLLRLLRTQPGWPDMPQPEPAQGMSDVLTWLYEAATGPVLDALCLGPVHEDDEREWPRIWWVPTGLLALLPLHAAGDHTSSGRSVLDRVVSSYTPSLTALCHSRKRRRPPAAHVSLIVALPQTPGPLDDLPGVAAEARVITRMIPHPLLLDSGDPARERPEKDTVLRYLRRSTIAHFACHGGADAQDPVRSRLFLADHETEPLTVGSLLPLDLRDAQLAFLSACRTSFMANLSLLDESLHLAAAFQLVGYPYVVGTLWNVGDGAAACFAFWFYDALSTWDRNLRLEYSAHAAHRATRLLRERFADDPTRWAAQVHFGA
ncbi:CHAT domain-containing protein [Streptomyces sp. NPDC013457]|uniref:CHAT domain-containing protein n=1 Tax=Streptomyces sp. NPDC013457 TaxID=3364866 RepID=UPI0036F6E563